MKNKLKLVAMMVSVFILTACTRVSHSPDDLVGTWYEPDQPRVTHTTFHADGTGEIYSFVFQDIITEIEWEYLGDGQLEIIQTPVHISQSDTGVEFLVDFRIERDQLIFTIDIPEVPGMTVERSMTRVE